MTQQFLNFFQFKIEISRKFRGDMPSVFENLKYSDFEKQNKKHLKLILGFLWDCQMCYLQRSTT